MRCEQVSLTVRGCEGLHDFHVYATSIMTSCHLSCGGTRFACAPSRALPTIIREQAEERVGQRQWHAW